MSDTHDPAAPIAGFTRRDFLRTTASAAVAASVAGRFGMAHAAGSDEIRVGLIGAGGRGTGALRNVLDAAPGVRVVAIGDGEATHKSGELRRFAFCTVFTFAGDEICRVESYLVPLR